MHNGKRPQNQIIVAGSFRKSRLSESEVLEFGIDLGILQLEFRIPIPEDSDEVPVYVRYKVTPQDNTSVLRRVGRRPGGSER